MVASLITASLSRPATIDPRLEWIVGVLFLLAGTAAVVTGQSYSRGGRIYRSQQPKTFWCIVATWWLFGLFIIGSAVHQLQLR